MFRHLRELLRREMPPIVTADTLDDAQYHPAVLKVVLNAVSKQSGRPVEAIPVDWLLVRHLELSHLQKSEVLTAIEEGLKLETLDGIHCLTDFTTLQAIKYYSGTMCAMGSDRGKE